MPKRFNVKEWKDRIRAGQRFQQDFGYSKSWDRYKDYLRHKFKRGVFPVNVVYSILRSLQAQTCLRNPRVSITPCRPGMEAELNARLVQHIDNWLIRELALKNELKKLTADSFLCGIANGFVGYDSLYGFDPDKEGDLTQLDNQGRRLEYNANLSPGMPWFLRARPEDVIWPFGCVDSRSAEWVALRVFRPLDDIKRDPKYTSARDLTGEYVQNRTGPEGESKNELAYSGFDNSSKRQWVELWQVHDARTGEILALNHAYNKFLREPQPDELQIDGLPCETLIFNPDPDYIYGIPDARIIEPQQLELNEIRTQAMKHRRVDLVKAITRKGTLDAKEIQKLTNESVMAIVEANTDGSLKDSIITFTPSAGPILQDLVLSGETVRGDIREMVGFSRIAQGEYQGKTHVSAAETKAVFRSLNVRLDERKDMIADLLTKVVRKFNQLIFTYWDKERVAQVVGPDGARWWLKYTGQQIKDEYDIKVTPEDGPDLDTGTKFEMARQAAESWANMNRGAIAQGAPVPEEIQRMLFSQFQGSGLDIDRLLAQSKAASQRTQAMLGAMGKTSNSAVAPGLLAQAMGG